MPKSAEERREVRSGLLRQVKAAGLAGAFLKTRHALAPRRQRLDASLFRNAGGHRPRQPPAGQPVVHVGRVLCCTGAAVPGGLTRVHVQGAALCRAAVLGGVTCTSSAAL